MTLWSATARKKQKAVGTPEEEEENQLPQSKFVVAAVSTNMESESISVRTQKQSARPACRWRCLVWWESAPRQTGAWIRVSRRCLLCGLCEIPPKRAIPCVRPFVSIWCQKRPSFGLNATPICEAAAISLGILRNSENENDDVDGCNGTIWLRLVRRSE